MLGFGRDERNLKQPYGVEPKVSLEFVSDGLVKVITCLMYFFGRYMKVVVSSETL